MKVNFSIYDKDSGKILKIGRTSTATIQKILNCNEGVVYQIYSRSKYKIINGKPILLKKDEIETLKEEQNQAKKLRRTAVKEEINVLDKIKILEEKIIRLENER
jgi:hypothetical protein